MQGSVEEFRTNWQRPETQYCHFTRDEPINQIQFAFRQNWLEFAKIMEPIQKSAHPYEVKSCLEVGAGRGTMSMYFADDGGFDCTLLDACEEPLEQARKAFEAHKLNARFITGDALSLPLADESFDVVFSYGLLEHFENPQQVIGEQVRVLKPDGVLIAYVCPFEPNTHPAFMWARFQESGHSEKKPVYRNAKTDLTNHLAVAGLCRIDQQWVYPFPMISTSSSFPFSLCDSEKELEIVAIMRNVLKFIDWASSDWGSQGFIVWGWKR